MQIVRVADGELGHGYSRGTLLDTACWPSRAPKSPNSRRETLKVCGRRCFLAPAEDPPGYPVCTKAPLPGHPVRNRPCQLDCQGLRAAYAAARGAHGARKRPDIAATARRLAKASGCLWSR